MENQKNKEIKNNLRRTSFVEDDSIDGYLEDNSEKRLFSKFFIHFQKKYEYKVCPVMEEYEEDDLKMDISRSVSSNENDNNIVKKFIPSNLVTKEKTCDFLRWITSIFQSINELEIPDFQNVYLFIISFYTYF